MTLTVDQFGKALVASGLMTADELKALWNAIPADSKPKQGDGFAKLLVQQGKLNQFQADELLSGRNTPLVMGDYVLTAKIGEGGMGQVYKAQHKRMNRMVALKVMSAAAMKDENAVKRFQREVHAAARLEHSNIVTAYDSGEIGNVKYLVMQFVDGGDLSQLVKQSGPLEIERAVDYVLQAARGLAFAHGEGVVHRDIKPANLLLDKKGVVKILDMGLARIEGGDGLTATEQVMGTVDYMSPEQAANTKTADGRSDIYSLGCTLWYLLTAKKLYDGDTMISRLMSHRTDPLPSLVKARDDVPWSLEQALHKMIAKTPEERFQTMDEVVAALAPFGPSGSTTGGMGSSIGMGPQSAEMASFLKSIGPAVKPQTKPAPTGTNVDVEATAQFAAAGADTDPQSEILPLPNKIAKPQAKGRPGGPGASATGGQRGNKLPVKLIAGGIGGFALLVCFGVWLIVKDKDGNEVASVAVPEGGSVMMKPGEPKVAVTGGPKTPGANASVSPSTPPMSPPLTVAQLLDSPDYVWSEPENLGPNINGPNSDADPTLTADELCLIFRTASKSGSLWECRRGSISEHFGPRMQLTGSPYDVEPCLTADGLTLISHSHAVGKGRIANDLRIRRRTSPAGPWSKAETLELDGDFDEMSPWLSPDGLTLIYSSNRPGGLGLNDLWICKRTTPAAPLGPSVNAGRGINSPASELNGQLLADGRTFLFARGGRPFLSFTSARGVTSALEMRGVPEDVHKPWLSAEGRRMYFHSKRPGGLGDDDIYVTHRVPKAGAAQSAPPTAAAANVIYLDDLRETEVMVYKFGKRGLNNEGMPIEWHGQQPAHSLYMHALTANTPCTVTYSLDGKFTSLDATVGLLVNRDTKLSNIAITFRVFGDGRELWKSPSIQKPTDEATFSVSVAGVRELRLEVEAEGDTTGAHAVWIEPRLTPSSPPAPFPQAIAPAVLAPRWPLAPSRPEDIKRLLDAKAEVTVRAPSSFGGASVDSKLKPGDALPTGPATIVGMYINGDRNKADDALLGLLATLTDLENLDFGAVGHSVTPAGVQKLAALTNLRRLNLRSVGRQSQGLSDLLKSWPHLEILHLPGQGAADEWAAAAAARPSIVEISAYRSGLSDAGLAHLEKMPQLKILRLHDSPQLTQAAIDRFAAAVPGCRIQITSEEYIEPRTPVGIAAPPPTAAGNAPPPAKAPFDAAQAKAHQAAWAKHLGTPVEKTIDLPGGAKMTFVLIPPGEFLMGSSDEDRELFLKKGAKLNFVPTLIPSEGPRHSVQVSRGFYLSATEVTQGQFQAVMGATPWKSNPDHRDDPGNAANAVTWDDATKFCSLASQSGPQLRLPTEAEWEYACRAGTTTAFNFGDWDTVQREPAGIRDHAWIYANTRTLGNKYAHRVGQKLANGWGLFDMHGNVWEWCSDWYGDDYYAQSPGVDPTGPSLGSLRVSRGGAWGYEADFARSGFRFGQPPDMQKAAGVGFRAAMTIDAAKFETAQVMPLDHDSVPPIAVAPFDAAQAKAHQVAWAKHLGTTVETVDSVGAKMILIPPGEFLMGSSDADIALALKIAEETKLDERIQEERPQHLVRITKPLRLSAHEVTIGQFAKFIEQAKYKTQAEEFGGNSSTVKPEEANPVNLKLTWRTPGYTIAYDSPVTQVSWNDAAAFCNWLSDQEKLTPCYQREGDTWALLPNANGYRLPTEAEWEYACRAGTATQFWFGDDRKEHDKYGWSNQNAGNQPHAVGSLPANPFGLYDLHGNVWEWCHDGYDGGWYQKSPQDDPLGPIGASDRMQRGGSWLHPPARSRSSSRSFITPSHRRNDRGFRLALSSVGPTTTANVTPPPTVPAAATGKLFMHDPAFPQWMKDVQAMPAEEQIEAVSKKLMELNSGFDGKLTANDGASPTKIVADAVVNAALITDHVSDLSPVRAFGKLTVFKCGGTNGRDGKLFDLSPLQGLPITDLQCSHTQVADLSPLNGMSLTRFYCGVTRVADLASLRGMPLRELVCDSTDVVDVTPLEACRELRNVYLKSTKVTAASVAALQKVLPDCKIVWDDPAKPTTPSPAASGTK